MALDWSGYAQGQRTGIDFSGIKDSMSKIQEKRRQLGGMAAQDLEGQVWGELSQEFENIAYSDVANWKDFSFINKDVGAALFDFRSRMKAKGPEAYFQAQQANLFNPMAFKQKYEQLRSQYTPIIEQKLLKYKEINGWSDRQFQEWMNHPGNNKLRNYMLDYADPAGMVRELSKPYVPRGFIGGAAGEVMRDPIRYGSPIAVGAGAGAIAGGIKDGWKGALAGAKSGANPLAMGYLKATPGGKGIFGTAPTEKELAKALKGKVGTRFDKMADRHSKRSQKALNKIKASRNSAFRRMTGKNFIEPKIFKNGKLIDNPAYQKLSAADKKAQTNWSKSKKTVGGRGRYKDLTPQQIMDRVKKGRTLRDVSNKKVGQGAMRTVQNIIKKHGMKGVTGTLVKKLGWRAVPMLARIVGGTALTGSGIGTAAGVAMNLYTVYEIANILKEAYKETPGSTFKDKVVQNPYRTAFGGRTGTMSGINSPLKGL